MIKECCQNKDYLEVKEFNQANGTVVLVCTICGCRHFKMMAEMGELGITLKG